MVANMEKEIIIESLDDLLLWLLAMLELALEREENQEKMQEIWKNIK